VTTQGWDCAEARISLGVYVLGAIDPAERAMVDAHLATCRDCRDELAGLASLPALLARVSPEELSRIEAEGSRQADEQPPPELIGTVLDLAAARRRRTRWRYAAAAAAVVALVAGVFGGLAASGSPAGAKVPFSPGSGSWDEAGGTQAGVTADVWYASEDWGTAFAIKVKGISVGTTCQMWVKYTDGHSTYVTAWTTGNDEGKVFYWGSLPIPPTDETMASIQIMANGQTLVNVPTALRAQPAAA
jgi:hypothetical protein